jgi:hypothetical protein
MTQALYAHVNNKRKKKRNVAFSDLIPDQLNQNLHSDKTPIHPYAW